MNRRQLGAGLVFGALGAGAAGAAPAQPFGGLGPAERQEVMDTARVGTFSLLSSRLAQSRARATDVREFADFEVAEQTTIAQVLQEASGMGPPPPTPDLRAQMAGLEAAGGYDFERRYVAAQVLGHRQLLGFQDRYLATGRVPAMRHVAMLARTQILEHLRLLRDIQARRGV